MSKRKSPRKSTKTTSTKQRAATSRKKPKATPAPMQPFDECKFASPAERVFRASPEVASLREFIKQNPSAFELSNDLGTVRPELLRPPGWEEVLRPRCKPEDFPSPNWAEAAEALNESAYERERIYEIGEQLRRSRSECEPKLIRAWRAGGLNKSRPAVSPDSPTARDAPLDRSEDRVSPPVLATTEIPQGATIPPEFRTEPMSLAEAGMRLGFAPPSGTNAQRREAAGKAVRRAMNSGGLRFDKLGTKYVFDKRQFPSKK